MNEDLIQAGINYYARNKYWRHVQEVVKFGLKRLGNDPVMHFWNGFGLLMEGRTPEATRELTTIVDQRDVTLCASLALIQAHKAAKVADKEAIAQFEERVKNEVKNCGEIALQQAALFMFVTGRHDKARDLVDKLIKMNANNADALALRGWIDLTCGRDANSKKSLKFFDDAIKLQSEGKLHADALFGKIAYLQKQKSEFQKSLELINTAVVQFPSFLPALIEKSKALVSVGDWEQATETAGRCLNADAKCVEAMRVLLLHKLCRTGNYTEASKKLGEIIQALDSTEPNSHRLYFEISQSAARLSGRHRLVLQQTTTLLERAIGMNKDSPDYLVEQGYQLLLADSEKEALKAYRQAMQIDQSSVAAINGVILCQLLDGQIEEAAQQLEFLNEIQSSIGKNAEHSYLGALLAAKKNDSSERVLSLLDEAVKCQLEKVQGQCVGEELFVNMSPDFMLQMAKLYMQYAPTEAPERGEAEPPVLQKCARLLESLTKIAPGLLEAVYLLAKTKFLSGNTDQALSGAQYCLKQDSTFSDAHLLMAQIQLASGNAKAASTSLEVGLSFNFEVREAPLYHIISAKIFQVDGKLDEAMKALQTAMKLPGIRKAAAVVQGAKKKTKKPVVLGDRVSVYLETAKVYWLMNQQHEATKVIQDALTEFQGTPEEIRIIIANAEFAVSRGDIDGALSALRDIKPTQTYFVQAREKMAEIYLKHRKDKRLYAACYRELVDLNPSSHAHLLLGDAYMNIQEPEKAIAVYESALKKNPRDGMLASKIGSALVKTHDYNKAINYYEAAVKSGEQSQLRADLAELYIKLKQYDKAEKVITSALESENNGDLAAVVAEVRYNMLLARMQNSAGKAMMAIQTLARARETQAKVINRVAAEQPEILKQQQQLAADICFQMAEHHDKVGKDSQKAIINYQDALQYDETNIKALLALSKLYLARGDLEAAQFQLATLLRIDKVNNDGTVMMADLMFRKQEYDSATFHFQQLLERDPEHYEALARLVDLLRRAGKLALCPKFLDQAEKASTRSQTEPGFNYCKGLYKRYTNCPIEALKHFNYARKDSDWGIKAIYNMIEICINPEDDTIGGETFQSSTNANEAANLKTADRLLQELQDLGEDRTEQFQAMRAYALMASKQKVNIEKALNEFIALAKGKEDNAVALLGMSRAYMLLKQSPKARSQLKLITKLEWTPQEAETFEAAWLLFADLYIDTGKYDLAQELLKKVLQHNKSCSRAWEYMGFIMEKEQSYANAAEFYENAWSFCNESNATVGFKLAFNYLKAKRCVDAIDICHAVLKKDPQFPKIRKEVLDKARQGVRV